MDNNAPQREQERGKVIETGMKVILPMKKVWTHLGNKFFFHLVNQRIIATEVVSLILVFLTSVSQLLQLQLLPCNQIAIFYIDMHMIPKNYYACMQSTIL